MLGRSPRIARRTGAPQFLGLLSDADRAAYAELRAYLSSAACRNRRNKRLESFGETLDAVRAFAVRGAGDDWARCLVCGVVWLPGSIATNTRQLRLLTDKCKSSINGSLQRMGYAFRRSARAGTRTRSSGIGCPRSASAAELRQWTVRQAGAPARIDAAASLDPPRDADGWRPEGALFADELALPLRDWADEREGGADQLEEAFDRAFVNEPDKLLNIF
jgi:hypothetical protein